MGGNAHKEIEVFIDQIDEDLLLFIEGIEALFSKKRSVMQVILDHNALDLELIKLRQYLEAFDSEAIDCFEYLKDTLLELG